MIWSSLARNRSSDFAASRCLGRIQPSDARSESRAGLAENCQKRNRKIHPPHGPEPCDFKTAFNDDFDSRSSCYTIFTGDESTFDNTDVPGIGPVTARVGVSPGPLGQCEPHGRFAADQQRTTQ